MISKYCDRVAARVILGVLIACVGACSGSAPKLYPVSGKLYFDQKPAEGATVVLHRVDGAADALKPSGKVGADGAFTLSSYPHGDGAPAGEYVVVATWYPPDARHQEHAKNKLPEIYGRPDQSPLRAVVKDGPTVLDLISIPK